MDAMSELQAAFRPAQEAFLRSPGIARLVKGEVGPQHYAWYLRQVFHHTRENPQIHALATVYFRGHQRTAIKRFFRHASAELGHEQLALEDLREMGYDVEQLPYENPLPETAALIAFPFHQIYNLNPVGYLGYLYFLEFLPTASGGALMDALARAGVPSTAMHFLKDHVAIDAQHNQFMEGYARTLIQTERELASVIYAMRVTGVLYGRMIEAAFLQADRPVEWGLSMEECVDLADPFEGRKAEKSGERPRLVGLGSELRKDGAPSTARNR